VSDWSLLNPKGGLQVVADPVVDKKAGEWTVRIRQVGEARGQLCQAPAPTYKKGKAVSLFSGNVIPAEYIKAKALAGEMRSRLYAVAVKTPQGLTFEPPVERDLDAIEAAAKELKKHRARWEKENVIPTERIPVGDKTGEPLARGITTWADMFSARQLIGMGVLVEELRGLRPEIVANEGAERGAAIEHLLAFAIDKFANWNSVLSSWNVLAKTLRSVFDTHDFGFKSTFAEMAPCNAGGGLQWAIGNVLDSWQALAKLPRADHAEPVRLTLGSATALPGVADKSLAAVVVDPPYDDNVQTLSLPTSSTSGSNARRVTGTQTGSPRISATVTRRPSSTLAASAKSSRKPRLRSRGQGRTIVS
jgi:adenine-specific DNA methylase